MSDWVQYNPTSKNWENSNDNGETVHELPFHIGDRTFGIGRSDPDSAYQLEVYKPGADSVLGIISDPTEASMLDLRDTDGIGWTIRKAASSTDMIFSSILGTDYFRFKSNGLFGIGVDPSAILHIASAISAIAKFETIASAGGYIEIEYESSGSTIKLGSEESIMGSGSPALPMIYTAQSSLVLENGQSVGFFGPKTTDKYLLGSIDNRWLSVVSKRFTVQENTTAPGASASGHAIIYSDSANNLKARFSDGTIKTFTMV